MSQNWVKTEPKFSKNSSKSWKKSQNKERNVCHVPHNEFMRWKKLLWRYHPVNIFAFFWHDPDLYRASATFKSQKDFKGFSRVIVTSTTHWIWNSNLIKLLQAAKHPKNFYDTLLQSSQKPNWNHDLVRITISIEICGLKID